LNKKRILISVRAEFDGDSPASTLLREAGFEAIEEYGGPDWADDETREKLANVDGIVAGNEHLDANTMAHAGRLRIVARYGVGYDRVDLAHCTHTGVVVTNTPGAMAPAVADLAFGLLLALVRNITGNDARLKSGGQSKPPIGEDLESLTLGLVGCGLIGTEVVQRAAGFGMTTVVHDPWADAERIRGLGCDLLSLEQLLQRADVVSLHLPLTDDSAGLVDARFLHAMKQGSYLINTARGGLVDEAALITALRAGHLKGAGIDCQVTEPPVGISRELVGLPNVVATSHVGSLTLSARRKMALMAGQSVVDFFAGRTPQHVVNSEVLS
jgi:phosphoglycerate dehydrogenase-like enzyme